jgi:hypothetical protein
MKFEGKKSPRDFQRDNQWRQKSTAFEDAFFGAPQAVIQADKKPPNFSK